MGNETRARLALERIAAAVERYTRPERDWPWFYHVGDSDGERVAARVCKVCGQYEFSEYGKWHSYKKRTCAECGTVEVNEPEVTT